MAKKKKRTTKKKTSRSTAVKPRTKSQIIGELADATDLTRNDIRAVFEAMETLIKKDLGRRGPGTFNMAGLAKIRCVRKPATRARRGINPFTGEETTFKAKPARNVVKITSLKGLKDMV